MDLFFFVKLLIVIFFLVMFLRGSKVVWGIGLLTVSTAFVLDTIWSTFGREEILADVGFFFYVLTGGLFAGAAIWLWSLLRKHIYAGVPAEGNSAATPRQIELTIAGDSAPAQGDGAYGAGQELFEQIRFSLGPEDVRDLIFDLQLNENDVLAPQQEMTHTVTRLVNLAQQQEKMARWPWRWSASSRPYRLKACRAAKSSRHTRHRPSCAITCWRTIPLTG